MQKTNSEITRRGVIRKGAKLAYVAPVVIATMKATPAFAGASAGGSKPSIDRRQRPAPYKPNP